MFNNNRNNIEQLVGSPYRERPIQDTDNSDSDSTIDSADELVIAVPVNNADEDIDRVVVVFGNITIDSDPEEEGHILRPAQANPCLCVPVNMGYGPNYPQSEAAMAAMYPWYNVAQLMNVVTEMRTVNFSIVEARQQALTRLNSLIHQAPYGENVRFPEEFYITEYYGDWARKFQQLRMALNYKDKEAGKRTPEEHASYNDTIVSFYNSTTAIMHQIARRDGVFNQASFEAHFRLRWVPPPPNAGGQ